MILVEIEVPSVDRTYDFRVDEDANIHTLMSEVGELIAQKEHCAVKGDINRLILCSKKDNKILSVNKSLRECGISTGDSLILI